MLDPTGHRLSVAELGSRMATYTYDSTYRLTSETVAGSPAGPNGRVSYSYDPAGNRLQTASTLAGITAGSFTYDADDRLTTDTYDADGNTLSSGGIAGVYDFENHLVRHGSVTMVYDGDGNRVSKTAGGVTTKYLVDDQNLTGFAQVIEESGSDGSTRKLVYGLERISQRQVVAGSSTNLTSFYGYDGHGSVRALTGVNGTVTDTYDYDAFGNSIHTTGSTPNEFLFAGEQFDTDLGLYYNRARYLNPATGRFFTMDSVDGDPESPISLHKYLYANGDPVSLGDPSGNDVEDLGSLMVDIAVQTTLNAAASWVLNSPLGQSAQAWVASLLLGATFFNCLETGKPDAWLGGFGVGLTQGTGGKGGKGYKLGITFTAGQELLIGRNGAPALFYYVGAGVTGGETASAQSLTDYLGVLWSTPDSDAYAGSFFNVGVPIGSLPTKLVTAMKLGYSAMAQAAILSTEGSSSFYKAIVYGLVDLSYDLFMGSSMTFFTGPTGDDPSRGFSGGVGFSNGTNTKADGASTSNLSITLSYFFQFGGTVSFR
jgi:RHS repeat-associated protein